MGKLKWKIILNIVSLDVVIVNVFNKFLDGRKDIYNVY